MRLGHTIMQQTLFSLRWGVGVLVLCAALAACTHRIEKEEASAAAARAGELYPSEFAQRAPSLTEKDVRAALALELDRLSEPEEAPRLVREYIEGEKPRFLEGDKLREDQLRLVQTLCAEIPQHAIDPTPYPCDDLKARVEEVGRLRQELERAVASVGLEKPELERLAAHIEGLKPEAVQKSDGSIPDATLVAIVFGQGMATPLPEIEGRLSDLRVQVKRLATRMAQVEVVAHRVLLRYAWDMRARDAGVRWELMETHRVWLDGYAKRENRIGGSPGELRWIPPKTWPKNPQEAVSNRLQEDMGWLEQEPLEAWITRMRPQGDQYARLLAAHARYQRLVEAGGFEALPKDLKLKEKQQGAQVAALRARLAQEGFEASGGGDAELFDAGLTQALKRFQRAHQLEETGSVGPETVAALNVRYEDKLAKIQVALQKWREAPPRGKKHIYINLPDYHGEFWVEGERKHRYKVVVGDTARKVKDGEPTMVNATPRLWAVIDRVIYNPAWNVPERIFQNEILSADAKALPPEEQALWLQEKGYSARFNSDGEITAVSQPPGPGNALGQVKIIFPNPYDVYMHDTSSKTLFKKPRRAFSHGCMRVHEPLTLAQVLLEEDGQYDGEQVRRALGSPDSLTIMLREKIPVHIGYITVRVDEEGTVSFLHDVYQLEQPRLDALKKDGLAANRPMERAAGAAEPMRP